MNRDICAINFTGLTHDHTSVDARIEIHNTDEASANGSPTTDELCSVISILKRHPMYDCLLLVKKYRNCLGGYSLEFPIDALRENERLTSINEAHAKNMETSGVDRNPEGTETDTNQSIGNTLGACSRRRLVSRFLDGDDPIVGAVMCSNMSSGNISSMSHDSGEHLSRRQQQQLQKESDDNATVTNENEPDGAKLLFMRQMDDKGEQCDLVHVPVNGLLTRLENYTRNGIAVDSRVYAFAMGLKTAERMMTTKSMKELQETPI